MTFLALLLTAGLLPQQPVPQPFPKPGATQPARPAQPPTSEPSKPAQNAPPATPKVAASPDPSEATLGVPIYPGAQFLASYDAGRGQRYFIFGSGASYADLVAYYRTILKQRGDLVFDVPATYIFEIGRFREETMVFPPSVTIKDYTSEMSVGYPNPRPGALPGRFPSIIQIVPVTER